VAFSLVQNFQRHTNQSHYLTELLSEKGGN
jgi:hypothetical protein